MDNFFLNIDSDNIGGYFSSEQIDLLSIVQCQSIEELQKFIFNCDQINELYSLEQIISLNNNSLEFAKRKVFRDYQDSMVIHDASNEDSINNKLKYIGIQKEDFDFIKTNIVRENFFIIRQYMESKYGKKIAEKIMKLSHHFVSMERDSIKAKDMYDEFVLLNSQLNNFKSMLIASQKIYIVLNKFYTSGEKDKRFDFYHAKRDLDFAYRNGKQVRFHSLLVKYEENNIFAGKSKEDILAIMEEYVQACLDFISKYNETHKVIINGEKVPVIKSVDLFNEIISFDKNEQGEYYNIWESKYGISMEEILSAFKYAQNNKQAGISYLYNEPFLEDDDRRAKVIEMLTKINKVSPGLIDTLGSQMHITINEDLSKIERCFDDLRKLQAETGIKIQITEFDMSLGSKDVFKVFGNDKTISLEQIYSLKKEKIAKISDIIKKSGVNLSGITYWSLTDKIDCNLERLRTNALKNGQINDIEQIPSACGGLIPTHKSLIKTINMSPKFEMLLSELLNTSLLSSEQALEKYSHDSNYLECTFQASRDYDQILNWVKQQKLFLEPQLNKEIKDKNTSLSDEELDQLFNKKFYQQMMISFLSPVVDKIEEQFAKEIPLEKLKKVKNILKPENIIFTFDNNQNDIQANSESGQLIINPSKTKGNTIEEKIVSSLASSIHEVFHILINMLKSPEHAEAIGERLLYNIATSEGDKEVHFAPGKYGQVLSEGFVEKISSEFAKKNGFFFILNPSYIPYVEVCKEIMEQDNSINSKFLFTKSADDVVNKMSDDAKINYEEIERLVVLNNFVTKEAKTNQSLLGITSENVKDSWMERNGDIESYKRNDKFNKIFTIERKFDSSYQDDDEVFQKRI